MESKGFGKPTAIPTRAATKFMRAALKQIEDAWPNPEKAYPFFHSHLAKLNESLLEALPLVFTKFTADKQPEYVAELFLDFGAVVGQLAGGNRALNLELSITASQLSLKVLNREAFPEKWAMAQNNLGNAYCDRIRGDRADNLEQAIAAYELALQIHTRESFPKQWALKQNNLSNAYRNRIRGDQAENLEKAIEACELALLVRTREAFPEGWAMCQHNLANAYYDRIQGDRADNLEKGIEAYELALQVRTRNASPGEWALTQNNLGNAYSERIRGDRAQNIEEAISAYAQSLEVMTRENLPVEWATSMMNLAAAYRNRIRGDRAQNIEEAIAAYEQSLQVRTREAMPVEWAQSMMNLANAYSERIRGDQAQNIEEAIAAYEQALTVITREALPQDWTILQRNLASTLLQRFEISQDVSDVNRAIAALEVAEKVAIPGTGTYETIPYTLGIALETRYPFSDDPADLERASAAYLRAATATAEVSQKDAYIEKAGDSQYYRGVALTQAGQWYAGLAALEKSLDLYRQSQNRLGRADVLQQMARTHYLMGNLDKARVYFRDALRLYQAEANSKGEAACRAGLGRLLLRLNFMDDALTELQQACDQYQSLGDTARLTELQEVYALAQKYHSTSGWTTPVNNCGVSRD